VSLGFSEKIRLSQNQVHHRDTEHTEREIYFFVHREIPMDEKNVSNQIHEKAFFMVHFSKTLDQQELCPQCFKCRGRWTAFFNLSASPDKQKAHLCVLRVSVVKFLMGRDE
jgi:hypothetical protein